MVATATITVTMIFVISLYFGFIHTSGRASGPTHSRATTIVWVEWNHFVFGPAGGAAGSWPGVAGGWAGAWSHSLQKRHLMASDKISSAQ